MEEVGFRDEDWMELPREEVTYVISPHRVTNIPSELAALTISLEEDEPEVPKASSIDPPIEAQPIASVSVPLQLTYLMSSAIKSKLIGTNFDRLRTMYGILDEYQLRVASPKKRAVLFA